MVPWLSAVARARSTAQAIGLGFVLSFLVGLLVAPWVATAVHEFAGLPWALSVLAWLIFAAAFAQPHLVVMAPLVRWACARTEQLPTAGASILLGSGVALLYAGLDAAVPRLFDAGIGYALHDAETLRQAADLGGMPLLTFLVVFVNAMLWRIGTTLGRSERGRISVSHAAALVVILGSAYGYGAVRLSRVRAAIEDPDSMLQVAVVQGNVPNETRLAWARGDERAAERQLSAYMLPTEELIAQSPRPDLVVWPEATFPGVFLQPFSTLQRGRANKLDRQLLRLARPIVFGAYDLEGEGDGRILYNALFAINPRYDEPGARGTVQRYRKHRLLAFAEHIPWVSQNEWFKTNLPSLGFFGAGPGPGLFALTTADGKDVRLVPFICSESLSSGHVVQGVRQGGELLLNVGSDGWFGGWGEPQFHLAVSKMRSVETRRSQIRAANTGISAIILPDGTVAERTEIGAQTSMQAAVPVVTGVDALMLGWGRWFGWGSLVLGAVVLAAVPLGGARNRGRG